MPRVVKDTPAEKSGAGKARPSNAARAPWADKDEVLAALMKEGEFVSLLLKRRVSVKTAQETLETACGFLGVDSATADGDERLKPLAKYLAREKDREVRGARKADRGVRHVGETVLYKAQRGTGRAKKRRPFGVIPLSTLDLDGTLDEVKVCFEKDRIVITRKGAE